MTNKIKNYIVSQKQGVDEWYLCDFPYKGTLYELTFHDQDFHLEEVYTLKLSGTYLKRDRLLNYDESKIIFMLFLKNIL